MCIGANLVWMIAEGCGLALGVGLLVSVGLHLGAGVGASAYFTRSNQDQGRE